MLGYITNGSKLKNIKMFLITKNIDKSDLIILFNGGLEMHYIFQNKIHCNICENYLILKGIDHEVQQGFNHYLINIFDESIKEFIEKEEPTFLKSEKISLNNGYLATKKYKEKTIVKVGNVDIGGEKPVFISGPCSIESEQILREVAYKVKKSGAHILRGGAFKPRTSPYEFQGLGKEGVSILYKIGSELNMPIVTEILDVRDLEYLIDKADILQVGSRNMYNYPLLKELGKTQKPILLKRALSATIKEFLLSAEYVMAEGNEKVILCERGIRTYENYTRNTIDISAIALLKEMTHLPVLSDPSHATGRKSLIKPISYASIAAGADGLMIESHTNPDKAWSDGKQSIHPDKLNEIVDKSLKLKEMLFENEGE